MPVRYLSAQEAADLDEHLMSGTGGWQLGQLMELAGLSVACCAFRLLKRPGSRVLVIAGPGNNGGDGLVAARHLRLFGHIPEVVYPKRKQGLYEGLVKQLEALKIPVHESWAAPSRHDLIVDAIFGFSFKGNVRAPFDSIIRRLATETAPVLAVDCPSSWDIENGRPHSPDCGHDYLPDALISLSAPKRCSEGFTGRHFLGGRFLSEEFLKQYGLPHK
ncbi:NAD(P)H-hydrate epimerase [Savitreella phatthalungensis]